MDVGDQGYGTTAENFHKPVKLLVLTIKSVAASKFPTLNKVVLLIIPGISQLSENKKT